MKELNKIVPQNFRGAILITADGETVFSHCSGDADLANRIPNTMKTKFATASAGKAFVAVGILQWIAKGNLKFDTTLGELKPFELDTIDPRVTIRQLLTHTSGIPDYFDEALFDDYEALWTDYPNYKIRTSADLLPLFLNKPMQSAPGERFQYNNAGYVVLGLILERLSGVPFDEYLREHVFLPCGMTDTGYYELDRLPAQCANAYIWDDRKREYYTNIYSVDVKGTGAGGAFVTLPDIERFWNGITEGKLLPEALTEEMLRRQAGNGEEAYGYGFWIDETGPTAYFPYFQGCDPGVSFISSHHGEARVNITLVSNYCDRVWSLHRQLKHAVLERP